MRVRGPGTAPFSIELDILTDKFQKSMQFSSPRDSFEYQSMFLVLLAVEQASKLNATFMKY